MIIVAGRGRRRTRAVVWAAAVGLAAAAFGLWRLGLPNTLATASTAASTRPGGPSTGSVPAAGVAWPASAGFTATDDALLRVEALWQQGSLRGTEADGDWGRWTGAALQPDRSLRRRFDYLLTGLGEVDPAQLRAWIAAQVDAAHGPGGTAQVLAIWDRYLALLQTAPSGRVDVSDDASLRRAMAEDVARRSAALGPAWAHAFFADDAADAEAFVERRSARRRAESSGASAVPAPDVAVDAMRLIVAPATPLSPELSQRRDAERLATFGADGTARLQAEEAEWAAWEARLADARERRAAIAVDAQLSTPQRTEAIAADLTRHFSGNELVRARGLLGAGAP